MAFCSNCGTEIIKGDSFCSNCGTRVDADFDPAPAKPMGNTTQAPSYASQQSQPNQWANPNQGYQPQPQNQYQPYGHNPGYNQGYGQAPYGYPYRQDKFEWYIYLISFLIFPIGLYFYFANRREKPIASKNLLWAIGLGFLFWIL